MALYLRSVQRGLRAWSSDKLGVPRRIGKPISQDDVEYFSHLDFEAGEGPYRWMNIVPLDA